MIVLNIVCPGLGRKNDSVKDIIITVLSDRKNLNAKELHRVIGREYGKKVSYQAVHKVLLQLEKEGVLTKRERQFELNPVWVMSLKSFSERLQSTEQKSEKYRFDPKSKTINWHFDDISVLAVTMARFYSSKEVNEGTKNDTLSGIMRHGWWPFSFSFKDYEILTEMAHSADTFCVIQEEMPFDLWIARKYELCGFKKVKTGMKFDWLDCDIQVAGDLVILTKYSDETKAFLDQIYSTNKDLSDLLMTFIKQKKLPPLSVDVKLIKEPVLARAIKEFIVSQLEKSEKK